MAVASLAAPSAIAMFPKVEVAVAVPSWIKGIPSIDTAKLFGSKSTTSADATAGVQAIAATATPAPSHAAITPSREMPRALIIVSPLSGNIPCEYLNLI